jgi:hypothetical protein
VPLLKTVGPFSRPAGLKTGERVRCSSLVDWPVHPRLRPTMQTSTRMRNSPNAGRNRVILRTDMRTGCSVAGAGS